jgi:hypothetical protein
MNALSPGKYYIGVHFVFRSNKYLPGISKGSSFSHGEETIVSMKSDYYWTMYQSKTPTHCPDGCIPIVCAIPNDVMCDTMPDNDGYQIPFDDLKMYTNAYFNSPIRKPRSRRRTQLVR